MADEAGKEAQNQLREKSVIKPENGSVIFIGKNASPFSSEVTNSLKARGNRPAAVRTYSYADPANPLLNELSPAAISIETITKDNKPQLVITRLTENNRIFYSSYNSNDDTEIPSGPEGSITEVRTLAAIHITDTDMQPILHPLSHSSIKDGSGLEIIVTRDPD